DPEPMTEAEVHGDLEHLPDMVREGAKEIMVGLDPYVVALQSYNDELSHQRWDFPATREPLRQHIENPPPQDNSPASERIGRMYRVRAQQDHALLPQDQQAELDKALEYLQAAYAQDPTYYYTNLNLGRVYAVRGDAKLADRYFARAVQSNPDGSGA